MKQCPKGENLREIMNVVSTDRRARLSDINRETNMWCGNEEEEFFFLRMRHISQMCVFYNNAVVPKAARLN